MSNESGHTVAGLRLYSPATVATYSCVGGLPLGCLLYGLNATRRGGRGLGTVLMVIAGASFVLMVVGAAVGVPVGNAYGVLGLFGAIGFYNFESGPFQRALAKGAVRARWWPPAVIAISVYVVIAVAVVVSRG